MLALLLLPTAASAEALIPPGNSAVNQYTESYPSVGGERTTRGDDRTPADVLGPDTARRLEAQAPAGKAIAALVAATAPRSSDAGGTSEASGLAERGAGSGSGAPNDRTGTPPPPDGPSGFSEVLGQATGLSTTGAPGALLLLAILLTAAWALAYLWRRRRPTA